MAQEVKASVKAVLHRARHGDTSPTAGEAGEADGDRDRLLVEMEAACVGSVEITTLVTPQGLRVEVQVSYDREPSPEGEGDG